MISVFSPRLAPRVPSLFLPSVEEAEGAPVFVGAIKKGKLISYYLGQNSIRYWIFTFMPHDVAVDQRDNIIEFRF